MRAVVDKLDGRGVGCMAGLVVEGLSNPTIADLDGFLETSL